MNSSYSSLLILLFKFNKCSNICLIISSYFNEFHVICLVSGLISNIKYSYTCFLIPGNINKIFKLITTFKELIINNESTEDKISNLFKTYYNSKDKALNKINNINDLDRELINLYLFIEQYKYIQTNLNKKIFENFRDDLLIQ